jgi:DNA-binding response OmpR family regulator
MTQSRKAETQSANGEPRPAAKILIVEDDASIVFGLERNLRYEGYEVEVARDGESGLEKALDSGADLIILDIMLPKVNGYEICKLLRKHGMRTPVIFLSAKSQEFDKVTGLDLGGDDYITKPFGIRELVARVKTILRRVQQDAEQVVEAGALRIDVGGHSVTLKGKPVALTSKEFKLLKFLIERRGKVLTREEILNHVWGFQYAGTARTIDNFINRLRQKIGDDLDDPSLIHTVRGVGYKFQDGKEDD